MTFGVCRTTDSRRCRGNRAGRIDRKRNVEGRAVFGLARDRNLAAEHVGKGLGDREAKPCAAEPARGRNIGLREALKQFCDLFLGHAEARVTNGEYHHVAARMGLPFDVEMNVTFLGKLGGVAEQVDEHLTNLHDVAVHRPEVAGQIADEVIFFFGHQRADGRRDVIGHSRDVEGLGIKLHLVGLDLRNIEHVVDEAEQMPRIGFDLPKIGEQMLLAHVLHFVFEHFAVADDSAERRAQFMAHIGEKLTLGPIGFLGGVSGSGKVFALLPLFGDIRIGPEPANDLTIGVADRLRQRQEPAVDAVMAAQRKRVLPAFARGDGLDESLGDTIDQLRIMRFLPPVTPA